MYIAIGNSIGASSRVNAGGGGGGFTNTYSLAFDGVDDRISIPEVVFSSSFSFSFWVKPANLTLAFIAGDINSNSYLIWLRSTTLIRLKTNSGTYDFSESGGNDIVVGSWQHITITRDDSNNINCYRNGLAFGSSSTLAGNFELNSIGEVYSAINSWRLNGAIDEFAVWDSVQDASTIYNSGVPNDLTSLNPVAWYRMGDNGTFKSPQWLIPSNENKDKVSNYSFSYDGVDDYVIAPLDGTSTGGILAASDSDVELTISLWFKLNSSANLKGIFQWANQLNDGTPFILMQQRNSTDRIRFNIDNSYQTTANVNIGQWYNVILTRTALDNTWRGYLDGVEFFDYDDGGSFSAAIRGSATDIYLANGYNGYAPCSIDEVAVWNSVQDASTIYNSGVPNDLASLSPVGYWRSEQSNFTDNWLVDNSALSNYSTRSFSFDGVDDEIQLSSPTIFTDFTLSFWYKQIGGAGSFEPVVGRDTITGGILTSIVFSSGLLHFKNRPGSWTALTTTAASNTEFKHYSITYNSSANELKGYCNGTLEVTTTPVFSGATGNEHSFNRIGSYFNAYYLHGYLDEISTFNTVKNATEVNALYNGGEPARIEGATSHWRMGEDATFNTNWSLPDNGSASNTGTSANMTIADLEGNAPNYTGGGLSNNMTIEDRVGDAPNSTSNALSYNMDEVDRETDVPT